MAERSPSSLPGERPINGEMVLHEHHLRPLLGKFLHRNGHSVPETEVDISMEESLKEPLKCLQEAVDQAEEEDKDAILVTRGPNTYVVMGRWIADHKGWVEAGTVATALGVAGVGVVAALVRKGVILRKHQR